MFINKFWNNCFILQYFNSTDMVVNKILQFFYRVIVWTPSTLKPIIIHVVLSVTPYD